MLFPLLHRLGRSHDQDLVRHARPCLYNTFRSVYNDIFGHCKGDELFQRRRAKETGFRAQAVVAGDDRMNPKAYDLRNHLLQGMRGVSANVKDCHVRALDRLQDVRLADKAGGSQVDDFNPRRLEDEK